MYVTIAARQSVCLTMIVKNEAHVLDRAIVSALSFATTYAIVDTGSEDDTYKVAKDALYGLRGIFANVPWGGFGDARTRALEYARSTGAEYALMLDADDRLEAAEGWSMPHLTATAYTLGIELGAYRYARTQIFRLADPWRYAGAVHEYPVCPGAGPAAHLPGLRYVCSRDGARSKDPDKYAKDAEILAAEHEKNPGDTRTVFYLAQSLRDAGFLAAGANMYAKRAAMGGFEEEVYVSLLERARISERIYGHSEETISLFKVAAMYRPSRKEANTDLARCIRIAGRPYVALSWAETAVYARAPGDVLFLDDSYTWKAADELAMALSQTGKIRRARDIWEDLLKRPDVTGTERARIQGNYEWSEGKT